MAKAENEKPVLREIPDESELLRAVLKEAVKGRYIETLEEETGINLEFFWSRIVSLAEKDLALTPDRSSQGQISGNEAYYVNRFGGSSELVLSEGQWKEGRGGPRCLVDGVEIKFSKVPEVPDSRFRQTGYLLKAVIRQTTKSEDYYGGGNIDMEINAFSLGRRLGSRGVMANIVAVNLESHVSLRMGGRQGE